MKFGRSIFISPGRLPNGLSNLPNINIKTPIIKIVIPKVISIFPIESNCIIKTIEGICQILYMEYLSDYKLLKLLPDLEKFFQENPIEVNKAQLHP